MDLTHSQLEDSRLLSQALSLCRGLKPTASNLEKIGAATSPEIARAAFAQWELRNRARAKFADADKMLFIREALEQASGETASAYHASLFPANVLVTDLTTGIGGDLVAFATRGPAQGFELDPVRVALAKWNLNALGLFGDVIEGDGMEWLAGARGEYVFVDPARRVGGRRTNTPEEFSPEPSKVAELGRNQELCIQKLSPFLTDSALASLGDRVEFISADGECKEVLAICGKQAGGGRFAVHVESGERLSDQISQRYTETCEEFFYDSDPSAVRAHSLGELGEKYGVKALGESSGYLTGPAHAESVWLKSYRVLYEGPGDLKTTKRKLDELGSSTPILKQRGAKLDLEKMRAALKLSGARVLIVACYPSQGRIRHAILETLRP